MYKSYYGLSFNPFDNLMTDALTLEAQLDKNVIDTDTILAAINAQALH